MSDDKQSMAAVVLKNPLCQAIGNNSEANSCLAFAFFERNKRKEKKSPDCSNLLTDRCCNGWLELNVQLLAVGMRRMWSSLQRIITA